MGAAGSNVVVRSGTCFLEVSFTAVYVDLGIHVDVEVHNDISLTGSCGTQRFSIGRKSSRWRPEYQEDGDTENHSTVGATRHDRHIHVISHIPRACLWIQKLALDHNIKWAERNGTQRSS